jgi:hypothetical protein
MADDEKAGTLGWNIATTEENPLIFGRLIRDLTV